MVLSSLFLSPSVCIHNGFYVIDVVDKSFWIPWHRMKVSSWGIVPLTVSNQETIRYKHECFSFIVYGEFNVFYSRNYWSLFTGYVHYNSVEWMLFHVIAWCYVLLLWMLNVVNKRVTSVLLFVFKQSFQH